MVIFLDKFVKPHLTLDNILLNIFGINRRSLEFILSYVGLVGTTRLDELDEAEILELEEFITQNFIINEEAELKHQVNPVPNTVREFRFENKLPMNGQRTHSNAETRRKK